MYVVPSNIKERRFRMKSTMEEEITVAKIPSSRFDYFCLKCNKYLEFDWKFCPHCGIELNRGMQ